MQTVIIVIHLMVVVALIGTVLLQKSEGGALGQGGGGGFMTGRGQANALTRATAILAALFFATSIILTLLANWSRAPRSILQDGTVPISGPVKPGAPPASGSGANVLDDIGKATGGGKPAPEAPAPSSPAPVSPAPAAPAPEPAPDAPKTP